MSGLYCFICTVYRGPFLSGLFFLCLTASLAFALFFVNDVETWLAVLRVGAVLRFLRCRSLYGIEVEWISMPHSAWEAREGFLWVRHCLTSTCAGLEGRDLVKGRRG